MDLKTIKSSFIKNKKTNQILMAIPRKQISKDDLDKMCGKKKILWRVVGFE